jgi:Fusaric acid resistance protein-like
VQPAGSSLNFFRQASRLDKSSFSLSTGFRSALFVATPMVVGVATGHLEYLFAGLGAFFLAQTEGPHSALSGWILLVACGTESAAFGLGTLAATTNFLLPMWLGIAVFLILLGRENPQWANVATFTAITFAVGIGLPGDSIPVAVERTYLGLLGSLFALLGAEIHRWIASRATTARPRSGQATAAALSRGQTVEAALAIALASALGFALGLEIRLPRDFWVIITIIFAVRPTLEMTLGDTYLRVGGTVVGAAIAAALTLEMTSLYVLVPLLFVFLLLAFSSRGVNVGLVQIFIVPYIVILLNILYPNQWEFALYRAVDAAIGGALAIGTVYVLVGLRKLRKRLQEDRAGSGLGAGHASPGQGR